MSEYKRLIIDGSYSYQTQDGLWHLVINGVDVLDGKDVIKCWYYGYGVYEYQTEDGEWHNVDIKSN